MGSRIALMKEAKEKEKSCLQKNYRTYECYG